MMLTMSRPPNLFSTKNEICPWATLEDVKRGKVGEPKRAKKRAMTSFQQGRWTMLSLKMKPRKSRKRSVKSSCWRLRYSRNITTSSVREDANN